MSYTYAQKKRVSPAGKNAPTGGGVERSIPNSARLAMLESGQASPTAAEKGHRVDMPDALRARMESSFGVDFSAVKLYESRALENTEASAMTRGNEIAFAPGKLDFASEAGQAMLGHELSHVASQSRGEVHGSGFLADSGLEARADREGAMAARGETVYTGPVTTALSAASPTASAAGPMQAKRGKKAKEAPAPAVPQEVPAEVPQEPVEETPHDKWMKSLKDSNLLGKDGNLKQRSTGIAIPTANNGVITPKQFSANRDEAAVEGYHRAMKDRIMKQIVTSAPSNLKDRVAEGGASRYEYDMLQQQKDFSKRRHKLKDMKSKGKKVRIPTQWTVLDPRKSAIQEAAEEDEED